MIMVIVGLFLSASFITSIAVVSACMLAGRCQEEVTMEQTMVSVESLHAIAEVELPRRRQMRQAATAHAGI
jgi:hypothetical protein